MTSMRFSRPRESSRPKNSTETMPVTPDIAKATPTASSEAPSVRSTMSGMTMVLMPPAMLKVVMVKPSPRSVALRHV